MFSKNIKLNEFVKIGDVKGRITDISFSTTEIKTETGEVYYFPNNLIYTKEIANLTKNKDRAVKIFGTLKLIQKRKFKSFQREVKKELLKFKYVDSALISLSNVTKDSVEFTAIIKVKKYSYELEEELKQVVFMKALTLNEEGLDIKK